MGRVLGKADFGGDEQPRYFIHCETSGYSYVDLSSSPLEAWRSYEQSTTRSTVDAIAQPPGAIHVIRQMLSWGRELPCDKDPSGDSSHGLATRDALLTPLENHGDHAYAFLRSQGVLHISKMVNGGFMGHFDQPICAERWGAPDENIEKISFSRYHGKAVDICPLCASKLLKKFYGEAK